ncbi:class I SAM-dependent methyltransferase [Sediminibacterium sp. TEGAF015]|uniref:class I SAM-dependent methyltransferase n=1 Tax=Sediminibacterium sp. TEGAF015 TaxID=575378 RepID=UPI0022305AAD|nr:class I SAM-dependent methyltransferase [Sediminibacterium sp. TEGAF015]
MDPFSSDTAFDALYPAHISQLASRHWTPLSVAKEAATFLAVGDSPRILDIGSGVGKFCLVGAHFFPSAFFAGVEHRGSLHAIATKLSIKLGLSNTAFFEGDFSNIDFSAYQHFYFYNSFYEHLEQSDLIDDSVPISNELFHAYNRNLYKALKKMPSGTRIATFHSTENEMPTSYEVVGIGSNEDLKFWIKL